MFEGFFTAAGTLIIIVLILYLTYISSKYIGRTGKIRGSSKYIRLVDQVAVGQDRTIAVIQTGADYFLVGITSSNITVLKEFDETELIELGPSGDQPAGFSEFQSILEKMSKRKRKE